MLAYIPLLVSDTGLFIEPETRHIVPKVYQNYWGTMADRVIEFYLDLHSVLNGSSYATNPRFCVGKFELDRGREETAECGGGKLSSCGNFRFLEIALYNNPELYDLNPISNISFSDSDCIFKDTPETKVATIDLGRTGLSHIIKLNKNSDLLVNEFLANTLLTMISYSGKTPICGLRSYSEGQDHRELCLLRKYITVGENSESIGEVYRDPSFFGSSQENQKEAIFLLQVLLGNYDAYKNHNTIIYNESRHVPLDLGGCFNLRGCGLEKDYDVSTLHDDFLGMLSHNPCITSKHEIKIFWMTEGGDSFTREIWKETHFYGLIKLFKNYDKEDLLDIFWQRLFELDNVIKEICH